MVGLEQSKHHRRGTDVIGVGRVSVGHDRDATLWRLDAIGALLFWGLGERLKSAAVFGRVRVDFSVAKNDAIEFESLGAAGNDQRIRLPGRKVVNGHSFVPIAAAVQAIS